MDSPARQLIALPVGTRVVVRYRIDGGFTDALGDLVHVDGESCTVRTRRHGDVVIRLDSVTAAKPVPPAPPRRPRRF
ncbi:putative acetyltransferase [Arthrobacter sp. CAN_A1]|uniref:putative acetyltransferase n=1 Tax=Arthrobacter sp. CAN_A1 TaxID=2787717 RepID=UPI0018CBB976